jgi:hypothetical protein
VILTKLALLLFTGESWGRQEATTLFFGISKLFQNKDASLRQMVYLVIKELAGSADDVIMVTSSIMKDTSVGSDVVYRPNAIRALCRVIDASTVQAIERLVKTCIVDKNPSVASAALVSAYHLLPVAKDVVRRWHPGWVRRQLTQRSAGQHKLHDTVPRHWPAVPDARRRQDELGQDGAAVLRCGRGQEPCGDRSAGQASG